MLYAYRITGGGGKMYWVEYQDSGRWYPDQWFFFLWSARRYIRQTQAHEQKDQARMKNDLYPVKLVHRS